MQSAASKPQELGATVMGIFHAIADFIRQKPSFAGPLEIELQQRLRANRRLTSRQKALGIQILQDIRPQLLRVNHQNEEEFVQAYARLEVWLRYIVPQIDPFHQYSLTHLQRLEKSLYHIANIDASKIIEAARFRIAQYKYP